jgi:phosphoglucosamine mutase
MLEAAVVSGLASEGVDALRVGVLPTPAVAYLTAAYNADFGVMISASHNPMPDNGIKVFGPGGHKLDDDTEDRIEELVAQGPGIRPTGAEIGRVLEAPDALDRYLAHLATAAGAVLDGLTVVVDCANGAAYQVALSGRGLGLITTEILPAPEFFYAEDYHQQYLAKNPNGYCGISGTGVTCPIGVGISA